MTTEAPETTDIAQTDRDPISVELSTIKAIRAWLDKLPSDPARFRVWSYVNSHISELAAQCRTDKAPQG